MNFLKFFAIRERKDSIERGRDSMLFRGWKIKGGEEEDRWPSAPSFRPTPKSERRISSTSGQRPFPIKKGFLVRQIRDTWFSKENIYLVCSRERERVRNPSFPAWKIKLDNPKRDTLRSLREEIRIITLISRFDLKRNPITSEISVRTLNKISRCFVSNSLLTVRKKSVSRGGIFNITLANERITLRK